MSAPYRQPGRPVAGAVRAVRFPRPVGMASIGKTVIAMIPALFLTFLWGWAEMDCSRVTGVCEVREWHSVVRRTHTVVLADLRGVRVTEQKAAKGGSSGVVWLETTKGFDEVRLSSIGASPQAATRFANELRAFLDAPAQQTLHASMTAQPVHVVVASMTLLLMLLGIGIVVFEVRSARRGTVLLVDEGRRIVSVPELAGEPPRVVPIGEIVAVAIDQHQPPPGAVARDPYYAPPVYLALVTRSGERIQVTPAGLRHHDAFDTDASRARLAEALGLSAQARAGRSGQTGQGGQGGQGG